MRTVKEMLATKYKQDNVIEPNMLVIDALKMLETVNLSYLVVMENNEFQGIFTERDYTRNLILKGKSSKETMVKDVMTDNLPVVTLDQSVEDCMYQMNTKGMRYLKGMENGKFQGIITIHDILREVIANKEQVFDSTLTNMLLDNDESGRIF